MELRHLRYFVAVAEEQNITRAAQRLHLSQPPLSRQIRDLEEELGVSLLLRKGKTVRLTNAGRLFLDESRAVLRRSDEAVQAVRTIAKSKRCDIHVGYAPSLTVQILPAALREFERLTPGARVTLHDLSTEEMLLGLREERLQVALMIRPQTRVLKGLRFEELRRYAVCVAMPSTHPLAHGKKPTLARIFAERLVSYTRSDYPEYHEWLSSLSKATPGIAEEHDSSTSLISAIEAGRGIALVPETFSCFSGTRLKVRPIADAATPFIVGVATCRTAASEIAATFTKAAALAASVKG